MELNPYGNNNPPYSLYQAPDGKWGLMDKDGVKLPAIFDRNDDRFSAKPWEVVCFNEQEGWDILAWYDPCEVWFNFTWEDEAYHSEKWGKLLWKSNRKEADEYMAVYLKNIPEKDRWLIDAVTTYIREDKKIDRNYSNDPDYYERKGDELLEGLLAKYPDLKRLSALSDLLEPILDNPHIAEDAKVALWIGKVNLDYELRYFLKIETDD